MPASTSSPLRVHLADPLEAGAAAHAVRDAVARTLLDRPERRAAFERLRGRVAIRLESSPAGDGALVGLVFDRGALTVWDGSPPGGTQVQIALPPRLVAGRPNRRQTAGALVGRRLRLAGAARHPRLTSRTLRLLGLL